MSDQASSVVRVAKSIAGARGAIRLLDAREYPIRDDEAYEIQHRVLHLAHGGEPTVGFKLGYTSQAMRDAMGITSPNHGPLLDGMVCESPAVVSSLMQPKVEPEFAVVLGPDLEVASMHASLEVVDSVWRDYRFTWAHNTADGSSAAFAVIGSTIPPSADEVDVTMVSDSGGREVARVRSPRVDVQSAVEWLLGSQELSRPLREGDVILTGGLSAPLDLADHGWIEAQFTGAGWQTSVRVERQEQR